MRTRNNSTMFAEMITNLSTVEPGDVGDERDIAKMLATGQWKAKGHGHEQWESGQARASEMHARGGKTDISRCFENYLNGK